MVFWRKKKYLEQVQDSIEPAWSEGAGPVLRLGNEVRWLQGKFDQVLEKQQEVIAALRVAQGTLLKLEGRVLRLEGGDGGELGESLDGLLVGLVNVRNRVEALERGWTVRFHVLSVRVNLFLAVVGLVCVFLFFWWRFQ